MISKKEGRSQDLRKGLAVYYLNNPRKFFIEAKIIIH